MPNTDMPSRNSAELVIVEKAPSTPVRIIVVLRRVFHAARMLHKREKIRIREEIAQIPGLMALLMKPRNGQKWTKDERAELRVQLRRLSRLGLYLTTAALPGTSMTLPLLAWWLDLRQRKRDGNQPSSKTE